MRKTRLVILPTKCLHQMGFLLLFLSCPVIGDWGRIQPESATSHEAIQIEREGTCAMQRESSEGLLDVFSTNGSNQCRLSEFYDSTEPKENSIVRKYNLEKSSETRRALSQRNLNKNQRILPERRVTGERREREVRRGVRRIGERLTRSSSVESRRMLASRSSFLDRKARDTRSQSLNRLERTEARIQRQSENERVSQRRLSLARQQNEKTGRRTEHQARVNRETRTERRENERTMERSERREERFNNGRLSRRSTHRQNGQRDSRRETERVNERLGLAQRERDQTRLNSERRLSLARMEKNGRETSRRQDNIQRRIISQNRVVRSLDARRDVREIEKTNLNARMERSLENQRGIENRRLSLTGKPSERRSVRVESRVIPMERMDARRNMKDARIDATRKPVENLNLGTKADYTKLFDGITTWMALKNYDTFKIGDWTTNCVIGAVAYFVTARQVKSV